jgi:hypothetical protein
MSTEPRASKAKKKQKKQRTGPPAAPAPGEGSRGAPYRGGAPAEARPAAEEDGLVRDLIRQFADPMAFYRELVQNAIDAGAMSIVVRLSWEPETSGDRGTMRVSVTDDGSGMSRRTLEEDLTVLFRSTKETRDDAIGKFGIGFVSVLAVAPEVVIVDTQTGDGERWTLHLHPDQTYDLYRADGSAAHGTTVSLHVALPTSDRESFVARTEAALLHWCRHVRIPIQLVAIEAGAMEPLREVRIDAPLALDALVSVQARSADGATLVVVGPPESGDRIGAFYNRGLLLHATRDHELGEVAFKVIDGRLEHTLSRDDVKRDATYERAIALVASTIRGPLLAATAEELARASDAYVRGSDDAGARLLALIAALARAELPVDPRIARVPVVARSGGRATASLLELDGALVTGLPRSALARALAASDRPVVDLSFARADSERERALEWLRGATDEPLADAASMWTLIVPIELDDGATEMLERTSEILGAVVRRPSALVLAEIHGAAAARRLVIPGGARAEPWLIPESALASDPFRFFARPPLVIDASHPIAIRARTRFATAPSSTSALLARAILVARGELGERRAQALTELALRQALGESAE